MPVAILIFLTASARTGVVATYAFFGANWFLARLLLGTFFRIVVTGDIGLLSTIFAHVLVALGFSSLDSDTLTGSLFHSCLTGTYDWVMTIPKDELDANPNINEEDQNP